MNLFSRDPLTASWLLALLVLFVVVVAVPLLRAVAAGCIYAYAHATGRNHLRTTAARVMPRIGHLIGSVAVGVASIAAPAAADTTTAASSISIDRDAGTAAKTPQPAAPVAEPSTTLYVVKSGDSLWSIAAAQLQSPTNAAITEQWKAIWRANRRVIGDEPEFIRPGMELVIDGASS
jgi:nucleoid-associated protein YgaU